MPSASVVPNGSHEPPGAYEIAPPGSPAPAWPFRWTMIMLLV